jgi:cytochrome b involved in lipid metabolism
LNNLPSTGPSSAPSSAGGTSNSGGNSNGSGQSSQNNGGNSTYNGTSEITIDCASDPDCITLEELARHNTSADCWIGLHGNVFNLTDYAQSHPGGARVITNLAGTNGTSEYQRFHSPGLLALVQGTLVGRLDDSLPNDEDASAGGTSNSGGNSNSSGGNSQNNGGNSNNGGGGTSTIDCASDPSCIPMEELASHKTADDCWIGLHGNVYDLTDYAKSHPGGARVITDLAGMDGTSEYQRFHSQGLLSSVQGKLVGHLEGSSPNGGNGINQGGNQDGGGGSSQNNGGGGGGSSQNNGGNSNTGGGGSVIDCANDPSCIPMEELASHKTADDCWIGLHGNVYDLTDYAKSHPGGARVITDLAGMDGTSEYQRFHSQGLLSSVQGKLVGRLEGSSPNGGNGINQGGNHGGNHSTDEMESEDDGTDEDDDDDESGD